MNDTQTLVRRMNNLATVRSPAGSNGIEKPTIYLNPGEIEITVNSTEDALLISGRGLYQRANSIVYVGEAKVVTADYKEVLAKRIFERGDHALLEDMSVAASFERFERRSKAYVVADPPMSIVHTLKERGSRLRFPILAGVSNAPTLRPDGSLLVTAGYDRATGLLFDPGSSVFPKIPTAPTKQDALTALAPLLELIGTFPFVDATDRSVALSGMLTAVVRPALPTAPMHAYTAPVAGSGKSKLVDVDSVLATGREAGVIAQGRTEEETEKRLGSILLAGETMIAIDNCEQPVAGEFLCSLLTQRTVKVRILGKSETPELVSNAFVTATGNNLVLAGDMTRRALVCSLDPRVERPELRNFDNDPVADAKAGREGYVANVLTILRAYIAAGRPLQVNSLGSFEAWSDLVRSALIWLGQADPVITMEKARASDPRLDELTAVVTQWSMAIGQEHVTVAQAIKKATKPAEPGKWGQPPEGDYAYEDFREALLAVAGRNGSINSRALGKWLARNKDRIVARYSFGEVGSNQGVAVWKLTWLGSSVG